MKAPLLKRLFRAIQSGSDGDVAVLCQRVIEEERKSGHGRIAEDLEKILSEGSLRKKHQEQPSILSKLPTSRRDSAPLLTEVPREELRHEMVLPGVVEQRLQRIEREFAAQSRLARYGLQPRRRVLLFGPPGCGKSLGAERLAFNTGLSLLKVRFDTLLSSYFGETHSNLRRVFDAAQETPSALFLDECDTLARSRLDRNDVGEATRITNALLEMLESYRGYGLVIAATNLDSALDPALMRRFDEIIRIPLPSPDEIFGILKNTLSSIAVERNIDFHIFVSGMDGMSCSEVTQIGRNAVKHCVLEGRQEVTSEDIRFALADIHERHNQSN